MNTKLQASSPPWAVRSHWAARCLAPLLVALVVGACGSEDNSNDSDSGAGGAPTTGDTMPDTGTTSTASATTSPNSTSSANGPSTMTSTTSNFGATTTGAGGAESSTSGMSNSTTGFGGPGFGGDGFGGQSAEATTTTGAGGTGGTDVSPGETGVFEGTVAAHNAARADVDVTPPLPEMVWSDELAEIAQDWANTLVNDENCGSISHRPNNDYGENIAFQSSFGGGSGSFTGPDAVTFWVAEIDCYTYGTIGQTEQCEQACVADLNSNGCGHYTQVVWADTTSVGCGYATCESGNGLNEVIVCNYDPPGNYIGQTPY